MRQGPTEVYTSETCKRNTWKYMLSMPVQFGTGNRKVLQCVMLLVASVIFGWSEATKTPPFNWSLRGVTSDLDAVTGPSIPAVLPT